MDIDELKNKIEELITSQQGLNYSVDNNSSHLKRWESRGYDIIKDYISEDEAVEFNDSSYSVRINDPDGNYARRLESKVNFLQAL